MKIYPITAYNYKTKSNNQNPAKSDVFQNKTFDYHNASKVFSCNFLNFGKKHVPVYIIAPDGTYEKCKTALKASEKIGCNYSSVNSCLYGTSLSTNGYTCVRADEVEIVNNGKIEVDENKIFEVYKEKSGKKMVYLINRDGSFKKYISQVELERNSKMNASQISLALNSNGVFDEDKAIVRACNVEKWENGKVVPDNKKINNALIKLQQAASYNAVYKVSKDGTCEKFNSAIDASKKLNISRDNINKSLAGTRLETKDCLFFWAQQVESLDKDGKFKLDSEKLDDAIKQRYFKRSIYKLTSDGKFERYLTVNDASEKTGINPSAIRNSMRGKNPKFLFIWARDIETKDGQKYVLNEDKIKTYFKNFKNRKSK